MFKIVWGLIFLFILLNNRDKYADVPRRLRVQHFVFQGALFWFYAHVPTMAGDFIWRFDETVKTYAASSGLLPSSVFVGALLFQLLVGFLTLWTSLDMMARKDRVVALRSQVIAGVVASGVVMVGIASQRFFEFSDSPYSALRILWVLFLISAVAWAAIAAFNVVYSEKNRAVLFGASTGA